jgi:hypothetical protein
MARLYPVKCLSCGHEWDWCKYDAPDDKCPKCNARTTRRVTKAEWEANPIWVNGFQYFRWWDEEKVKVSGFSWARAI